MSPPTPAALSHRQAAFTLAPVAFGVGNWRGVALDHSGRPLMGGLAFWSAATCCVASTLVQKTGR